jgi:hypothetical protein
MTEGMRKDPKVTTADIVRGERAAEAGPPRMPTPRGPAEHTERAPETRELGTLMPGPGPEQPGALFPGDEGRELWSRWNSIQTGFVDEPRRSVEQADALVATAVKRLAEIFADERTKLEAQWDRGDRISTEDLRVALQRYRSFFTRLLSV